MVRNVSFTVLVMGLLAAVAGAQPQPPAAAQAQQVGTIAGKVLDKGSGDPIIEAGVEVIGQGKTVHTDLDGKFVLKLPPGTYELRIFAPLYQGTRLTKLTVKAGEVTKADAALASAGAAGVEVVEVVAQGNQASEATQLLKRQKSAVVSDNVSGETIAKSPDADAAEVVQRVPSVTVKDEKFIVVRGLGERYSSALLNGSRLPSTDPLKRVVPLDLFPSEFIESLSIIKTYTPDLPGDFSGGLADIELREFPETLQANIGVGTGANTATTFRRFQTYDGTGLDYIGFGDGFRDLPSDFPIGGALSPPQKKVNAVGHQLKNIWDVESKIAPPNTGLNMSFGNSWGPLGLSLGGVYTTEYKARRNEVSRSFTNQSTPGETVILPQDSFLYDTSTFETRLGGILTSAYQINPYHQLNLRGLVDRNSYDVVRQGKGFSTQFNSNQLTQQLAYQSEELDFAQLEGEDRFFPWLETNWRSALSRSEQNTPDTRNLTFDLGTPDNPHPPQFQNDAIGGYRIWGELNEWMTDSAVDFTVPFQTKLPATDFWSGLPAKFKAGPAYTYRSRDHDLRFLRYQCTTCTTEDREQPPEQLLDPSRLGPNDPVQLLDLTQERDQFSATQEIAGVYSMLDLPLVRDRLRLIGGARVEYSLIRLDTANDQGDRIMVRKKNTDVLPGVNLVYSPRSDMNVRGAWSKTVSRPEFRELSPVLFPEPRTFRSLVGNPDLVESHIKNYDLRWEWFFSSGQLVAFSLFYKTLSQPIEIAVAPLGSDLVDRFRNAEDGTLKGLEFEGRKNFGFVSPRLNYVNFQTNVAYIKSNVKVPREGTDQQTSTERELQGQSPFVVNAAIEYANPEWGTARLLYNTAGRRIVSAGASGLPDFFEERRDSLDAVFVLPLKPLLGWPITSKLSVENILNTPTEVTLGGNTQRRFLTGTKFSFGLSYSY